MSASSLDCECCWRFWWPMSWLLYATSRELIPPLLQAYLIPYSTALKFPLVGVNVCIDLQCFVATYILNFAKY